MKKDTNMHRVTSFTLPSGQPETINQENQTPQLRQIRAVGIVTQIGAYFFLASGDPLFGSPSAMATLATENAAAAAAAKNKSLLPLLLSSLLLFLNSKLVFSPSVVLEPLATMRPRREEVEGCLVTVEAAPARKEALMVMEAISAL